MTNNTVYGQSVSLSTDYTYWCIRLKTYLLEGEKGER